MTTRTIFAPMKGPRSAWKRLDAYARLLRERVHGLENEKGSRSAAATWLQDNHAFLQFQIRELHRSLPPGYLRKLTKGSGEFEDEPRIYRIAADFVKASAEVVDAEALARFGAVLREKRELEIGELWAFGSMLKLALLDRLCADLESEAGVALVLPHASRNHT